MTEQLGHRQPGPQTPELFCRPHSGTFFCQSCVAFPGNSKNNVRPADPTKFVVFPGNSNNNVDQKPESAFLAKLRKKFRNGTQKKRLQNPQAWSGITWLLCHLHVGPLTWYFPPPPLKAATAADLPQAFELVLGRLRQQPT